MGAQLGQGRDRQRPIYANGPNTSTVENDVLMAVRQQPEDNYTVRSTKAEMVYVTELVATPIDGLMTWGPKYYLQKDGDTLDVEYTAEMAEEYNRERIFANQTLRIAIENQRLNEAILFIERIEREFSHDNGKVVRSKVKRTQRVKDDEAKNMVENVEAKTVDAASLRSDCDQPSLVKAPTTHVAGHNLAPVEETSQPHDDGGRASSTGGRRTPNTHYVEPRLSGGRPFGAATNQLVPPRTYVKPRSKLKHD